MIFKTQFQKSKVNFKVEKRQLEYKGQPIEQWGTFRADTGQYLAPVGEKYPIIQNEEVFKLPSLLVESGEKLEFNKAFAMDNGRRIYASFKLPKPIRIGNTDDILETNIAVTTMHGGGGLYAFLEVVRLVCTNGMTRAEKSKMISIRHSSQAPVELKEAQKTLLGITNEAKLFGDLMNTLAKVKLTTAQVGTVIENLFKDKKGDIYSSTTRQNKARVILTHFDENDGDVFRSQRGTAFNLYNAVTRYTDHGINYRAGDDKETAIRKGILFGAGAAMKHFALMEILKVTGVKYVY